ncbi:MAG TPA: ABC transporter permease [Bryobacteraceae bacterium]
MIPLFRRLQFLFNRRRFDDDLEEELRDHLRRKAADTGIDPRRQFGNVTLVKEESRRMWTWNYLEQLLQDIRYAFRAMSANRLFTAMAALSLALGIGANTAIYSFMDAVMLRALPVQDPSSLVIFNWRAKGEAPIVQDHWGSSYSEPGGGITSPNYPYPAFQLLKTHTDVLESLFGHANGGRLDVVYNGVAELADGQLVTGDYFPGLRVPAALGRIIGPDDDRPGAPPVVMITYDYWRSRFASDPNVPGKSVNLNGKPFTIIGVAAPNFYGVSPASKPHIFIPISDIGLIKPDQDWAAGFNQGTYYWIELMGRLKPGVTMQQAEARLAGPFHNFVLSTATKDRERADLPVLWLQEGGSGVDAMRRQYSEPLWILLGMAGLILLIACANIANLLLSRASSRRREMAVRLSLGAGRFRIIRQLLTESILLAMLGAAAGIGVAALGIRLLATWMGNGEDLPIAVGIDWRVLTFTLIAALTTGILFGLAPALEATKVDTTRALKETRSSEAHARTRLWGLRFGLSHILVIAQIALSLLLVVAAALFVRTLSNLHSISLGFNAENILIFHLDASKAGYSDAALKHFYEDVETRLQRLPGVRAATTTNLPMVSGWSDSTSITVPGIPQPPEGQRGPNTSYVQIGSTFFDTMEIPILLGRPTGKGDVEGAQLVAVVNQVFVDKYFKGTDPIGRHFTFGGNKGADVEIVGVARNARYASLKRDIPPVTYAPWSQANKNRMVREMYFELRAAGDPLALANSVRQVVREASPLVPVAGLTTQVQRIDQTISQERTFAKLCTWFGGLALLMACIGLYGTMAYAVARRTGEIGIRMALGAERTRIVWMVLREVFSLTSFGIVVGFAAVYVAIRIVRSQPELAKKLFFGLQPTDPLALSISVAILLGCALLAGFLPAHRASRIDPIVALRHE